MPGSARRSPITGGSWASATASTAWRTREPSTCTGWRQELGKQAGDTSAVQILDTVVRVVGEQKKIFPNVDLYSGAAYSSMGIATDQFTPIFAMSRIVGWAAHVMEQHANNRLIRPRAEYTGPTHATYVPIDRR